MNFSNAMAAVIATRAGGEGINKLFVGNSQRTAEWLGAS
jgi:hypothetical protein